MTDRVEYDTLAPDYDRRYAVHVYEGVDSALRQFVATPPSSSDTSATRVLEVGCGTGHWLAMLGDAGCACAGVDPSRGMLAKTHAAAPAAWFVQARAEALPWAAASFDRVIVVNALHHFDSLDRFLREARRVLRPGGGLLTIGLDPHTGIDRWWIYEHFPSARALDLARYPSAASIRERLAEAGFADCRTTVAQHWPAAVTVAEADERGLLDRGNTSQLMVIATAEYEAGVARIRALAPAEGEPAPMLRGDLRVYATVGWVPAE